MAFNKPDYSNFHRGCDNCGKILSQVRDTTPGPCHLCGLNHYCSPKCQLNDYRSRHKPLCKANLDAEIDLQGAAVLTKAQALWDLRKYTARWHDELACAAIAGMDLHHDPSAIDHHALVVHLAYIPSQLHRMQRFRFHRTSIEPLVTLTGAMMDAARQRQRDYTVRARQAGMVGSALIVLACVVPEVGFVFNSTYVGPEPDLLIEPPPGDWQERLVASLDGQRMGPVH